MLSLIQKSLVYLCVAGAAIGETVRGVGPLRAEYIMGVLHPVAACAHVVVALLVSGPLVAGSQQIAALGVGALGANKSRAVPDRPDASGRPGHDVVCQFVRASDTSAANLTIHDHHYRAYDPEKLSASALTQVLRGYPENPYAMPTALGHYVCVPPTPTPRRGALLVLAEGVSGSMFAKHAASLGYDAVALQWWAPQSSECFCGACLWHLGRGHHVRGSEDDCSHAIDLARLLGTKHAAVNDVLTSNHALAAARSQREMIDFGDSIAGRLFALLTHLGGGCTGAHEDTGAPQNASKGPHQGRHRDAQYEAISGRFWCSYARASSGSVHGAHGPRPAWERITVVGHSRGGIHGYLLAQRYSMPRVLFLDSPTNHLGNTMVGRPASPGEGGVGTWPATAVPGWINASLLMTAPERLYGLTGAYEGNLGCWGCRPVWDRMGLSGVATVTKAIATGGRGALHLSLGNAHQIFDLDICKANPPNQISHTCLLAAALGPARQSLRQGYSDSLRSVWSYMLTHEPRGEQEHGSDMGSEGATSNAQDGADHGSPANVIDSGDSLSSMLAPPSPPSPRVPCAVPEGCQTVSRRKRRAPPHANVTCAPMRGNITDIQFLDEDGRLV